MSSQEEGDKVVASEQETKIEVKTDESQEREDGVEPISRTNSSAPTTESYDEEDNTSYEKKVVVEVLGEIEDKVLTLPVMDVSDSEDKKDGDEEQADAEEKVTPPVVDDNPEVGESPTSPSKRPLSDSDSQEGQDADEIITKRSRSDFSKFAHAREVVFPTSSGVS